MNLFVRCRGLAALLVLALAAPAAATTITVDTTVDELNTDGDCSLREAVQAANTDAAVDACPAGTSEPSDPDVVVLAAGTYNLSLSPATVEDANAAGDLDVTGDMILRGAGLYDTLIVSPSQRVLHVLGCVFVAEDLGLQGSNSEVEEYGGVILSDVPLAIRRCYISFGRAVIEGGGVYAPAATVVDSVVEMNTALERGGGLSVADLTLDGDDVGGNWAGIEGGGIFADDVFVSGTRIHGNATEGLGGVAAPGGGISATTLLMQGSNIQNNRANRNYAGSDDGWGGGIYVTSATITNSHFIQNVAGFETGGGEGGDGGAIHAVSLALRDVQLIGNKASLGAGSHAAGEGGAVYTETAVIEGCTFRSNLTARGGRGGGLRALSATITDSTFHANRAEGGGAMYLQGPASSSLVNTTISGNEAWADAGGILSSDIELSGCTLTSNIADLDQDWIGEGGGLRLYDTMGTATLVGTIIAGNLDLSGPYGDIGVYGWINSLGYNLLQDVHYYVLASPDDIIGQAPLLYPLGDNGGVTWTHMPMPGSPVIDSGLCEDVDGAPLTVDQRGVARPYGAACDIGAVEYDRSGVDVAAFLLRFTDEPAGGNCANGGVFLEGGLDDGAPSGTAGNGQLEDGEVDTFTHVCDGDRGASGSTGAPGADGASALILSTALLVGDTHCPTGGVQLDSGLDDGDGGGTAGNGLLDAGEIDATSYLCNGAAGPGGSAGADGAAALSRATALDSGDATCPYGGVQLELGLDDGDGGGTAGDGTLDAGEVDTTTILCHGAPGEVANTSLLSVTQEPAGANCADGGLFIESGVDHDGDGQLDAGEVDQSAFICHGEAGTGGVTGTPGADGLSALIEVSEEPAGDSCAEGGQRIEVGLDDDGDGQLDQAEVDSTSYVCDGASATDHAEDEDADEVAGGCGCTATHGGAPALPLLLLGWLLHLRWRTRR